MGTVLYERGVFVNQCYDELNLSRPSLVEAIHREYVDAGARIIETNTFGANPVKLSSFGLDDRTEEINRAAVERARAGAGEADVVVVGAMGPLGIRIEPWGPTAETEAREYFGRQVDGLLGGGVDGFVLETFQDLRELEQALRAIRDRCDLAVVAQMTIEEGGRTSYGTDVETIAHRLEGLGADAVGLNCSVGPAELLDAIERMAGATDLPLSALPNAGLPRTVGGRKMYLAGPEYMARYARRLVDAGARLVGGCCGTTPAHIRAMADALDLRRDGTAPDSPAESDAPSESAASGVSGDPVRSGGTDTPLARPGDAAPRPRAPRSVSVTPGAPQPAAPTRLDAPQPLALGERSPLGRRLARGDFVTMVELVPPRGCDPAPMLAEAHRARLAGVDVVSIPDSPRGLARMASLPAALLVSRDTGLDVVAHYACRDRNMLGMISDLMGAAASGLRNLLLVTGDLSPTGPYPDHTTVFDIDAIGLTNVVRHLNHGVDPGGHPVDPPTSFVIGVALNHAATDLEREHRRFHWKVDAGAEFVVTQPVFDPGLLEAFLDRQEGSLPPIIAGLWPLDSLRRAEFLDNEVPGVRVPPEVLRRMAEAEARGPDEALEEGIRVAVEVAEAILPRVGGVQVSSPAGRVETALEVVRRIGLSSSRTGGPSNHTAPTESP